MKVRAYTTGDNNLIETNSIIGYDIYCPGCEKNHFIYTNPKFSSIVWGFNGDSEKPTFTPSLLCNPDKEASRCHSFITNGHIQFLGDCFHDLKNQTIELTEYNEGLAHH